MSKRMSWRLAVVLVACLLMLAVGSGQGQPQATDPPRFPSVDVQNPPAPPAPTVDDFIVQLEKLRRQKADLEKAPR